MSSNVSVRSRRRQFEQRDRSEVATTDIASSEAASRHLQTLRDLPSARPAFARQAAPAGGNFDAAPEVVPKAPVVINARKAPQTPRSVQAARSIFERQAPCPGSSSSAAVPRRGAGQPSAAPSREQARSRSSSVRDTKAIFERRDCSESSRATADKAPETPRATSAQHLRSDVQDAFQKKVEQARERAKAWQTPKDYNLPEHLWPSWWHEQQGNEDQLRVLPTGCVSNEKLATRRVSNDDSQFGAVSRTMNGSQQPLAAEPSGDRGDQEFQTSLPSPTEAIDDLQQPPLAAQLEAMSPFLADNSPHSQPDAECGMVAFTKDDQDDYQLTDASEGPSLGPVRECDDDDEEDSDFSQEVRSMGSAQGGSSCSEAAALTAVNCRSVNLWQPLHAYLEPLPVKRSVLHSSANDADARWRLVTDPWLRRVPGPMSVASSVDYYGDDTPLFGLYDQAPTTGLRGMRLPGGGVLFQGFDGKSWSTVLWRGHYDRLAGVGNNTMKALKNVPSTVLELSQLSSTKVVAASAVGGAVTTGAAGAMVGSAAGGTIGILAGVAAAPLTFGLSIPVGAAVGSCTGLVTGAASGSAAGAAGGSVLGFVGYRCASLLGFAGASNKDDERSQETQRPWRALTF